MKKILTLLGVLICLFLFNPLLLHAGKQFSVQSSTALKAVASTYPLTTGDSAILTTPTNFCVFSYDATSSASESGSNCDATVIQPNDVSGNGRWIKVSIGDFTDGGDVSGALRLLGNTDNYALGLKTNNLERLRILESGNVGIGTATPSGKLDVIGTIIAQATATQTTSFHGINLTGNTQFSFEINDTDNTIRLRTNPDGVGTNISYLPTPITISPCTPGSNHACAGTVRVTGN